MGVLHVYNHRFYTDTSKQTDTMRFELELLFDAVWFARNLKKCDIALYIQIYYSSF